jgi:P-type Cu+ transporter
VVRLAASLERSSQHPLGAAVVQAAQERKLSLADAQEFDAPVGKGVTGSIEGHRLVIGNVRMLLEANIELGPLAAEADLLRNIRQNLFLAFIYNAAGVPVAAGVLYPVLGILLSPIIAAAAMTLSSVSVISNALRLRRVSL